jgi:pimeloyl-ACP methyl ester carboxylesterase
MTSKPQRRDSLCELFWDETSDPKGALRWSLSKIRKFVNERNNERLITDRQRIMLLTNDVSVDVHHIKNRISSDIISAEELQKYLSKLESTFLEGLDLEALTSFQRWLVSERIEMEHLYFEVLKKLWNHPHSTQEQKLSYMKIGLAKDPYNIEIAKSLLQQMDRLGFISAKEKLLSEISQRFHDAGIKWEEYSTQTTNFADTSVSNQDILARQQIKFCNTKDNTRIAYASVGEGYPIIKAANWLSHLEYDWNAPIWSPLYRKLASKHRVIRYDERGNGLSDWDVEDLSFNAFVDDLETVVQQTNLSKFALLGISQGASVSIEYAIKHPDKVSHLILFGAYASGWRINTSEQEIRKREAIITLTEGGWGQDNPAYRQIFSTTFMPSANKEELDWFNEFQRQTTSPENAARFLSVFGDIDVREQLAKVQVPTIVIHSLHDQRIPLATGQALAASIPNAEFVGLESDGHLLLGREPASDVFVETVKDFIARN